MSVATSGPSPVPPQRSRRSPVALATRRPGLLVRLSDGRGRPVRVPGLAAWLGRVAPARARGEVGIALVGDARMRRLNRDFRGKDAVTDVLSFPAEAGEPVRSPRGAPVPVPPLGDIVIARGLAVRQAREAGHALATELRVLALHGLLHLCGYDHERDAGRMARLERRLRRTGGLPEGLIERGTRR